MTDRPITSTIIWMKSVERHRQEAADHDVDQHAMVPTIMPAGLRHRAAGQHGEHQAERRDLRRHPAQVAQDDGHRAEHLDARP